MVLKDLSKYQLVNSAEAAYYMTILPSEGDEHSTWHASALIWLINNTCIIYNRVNKQHTMPGVYILFRAERKAINQVDGGHY